MKTKTFRWTIGDGVNKAADILRAGGLVAFPTETVYGLGADGSNAQAVSRIFTVKGRPKEHPLIVHIGEKKDLNVWASDIPSLAWLLADHFWPGPLTIILQKAKWVPEIVTGGFSTIGLRIPSHPLALSLLKTFGGGIAAPSANRFGRVSPTAASHVQEELGDCVDFILDGDACAVGIESTIIDLSSGVPYILRPGGITRDALEAALGRSIAYDQNSQIRCPGQQPMHYAPNVRLVLAKNEEVGETVNRFLCRNARVAVLSSKRLSNLPKGIEVIDFPEDHTDQAKQLYSKLRLADTLNLDILVVIPPVACGLGVAIIDRLVRAAGPKGAKPLSRQNTNDKFVRRYGEK